MVAQELVAKSRGRINDSGHWRLSDSKAAATVDDISVIVIPVHQYYREYIEWERACFEKEQNGLIVNSITTTLTNSTTPDSSLSEDVPQALDVANINNLDEKINKVILNTSTREGGDGAGAGEEDETMTNLNVNDNSKLYVDESDGDVVSNDNNQGSNKKVNTSIEFEATTSENQKTKQNKKKSQQQQNDDK